MATSTIKKITPANIGAVPMSGTTVSNPMTGNLVGTGFYARHADESIVEAQNTTTGVRVLLDCVISKSGLWSSGYWNGSSGVNDGAWMLYRDTDGKVVVNNQKIETTTESISAGQQSGSITLVRSGNVRQLIFDDAKTPTSGSGFNFDSITLPAADRPKVLTTGCLYRTTDSKIHVIWVRTTGSFGQSNGASNVVVVGTLTWVV